MLDDKVKFNLALSLHAANDEKRNKIMPINESNSLNSLTLSFVNFEAAISSFILGCLFLINATKDVVSILSIVLSVNGVILIGSTHL